MAQLVEHRSPKPAVGGSSPSGPALKKVGVTFNKNERQDMSASADQKVGFFGRISLFLRQVGGELRKVVWPTKEQLGTYTVVVIVFVTLLAILVSALDLAFAKLMLLVFG